MIRYAIVFVAVMILGYLSTYGAMGYRRWENIPARIHFLGEEYKGTIEYDYDNSMFHCRVKE